MTERSLPPTGTVTFLFTDVVDSTRMWEATPQEMGPAMRRHDEVLRAAVGDHHGYVFTTAGDSFAAAFARAGDAICCGVAIQRRLSDVEWPSATPISARVGLHSGAADERDNDYFGAAVGRTARVMSAAHGGQVLATAETAALAEGWLPSDFSFASLGEHGFKGLAARLAIVQVNASGLRHDFPAIKSLDVPHSLPSTDGTLIGRSTELGMVKVALSQGALVSLVGVGGIGKTRLAIEIGREVLGAFPDGVWWCDLASVGSDRAVADLVAGVVGTRQWPGRTVLQSLSDFLADRQTLLVLDNCEHVIDAAADLVTEVVAAAPHVKFLATTREALGCVGERVIPVVPLAVDGADSASVELFLARAEANSIGREWPPQQLEAIERICRRLDGMPLALELAAAHLRSLSPVDLEAHLRDVFRALRGGRRSVERHRTLQAAIDWSYEMLDDAEQAMFERLSVFAGGFDLEAAAAVCAAPEVQSEMDALVLIDELVAKSMVILMPSAFGPTRYRLLEPLRQHGEDRLATRGDAESRRENHLDYFTRWAERWDQPDLADEHRWRSAIEVDFANARSAIDWAVETGDADRALRLAGALHAPASHFSLFEIGQWLEAALDIPGALTHPTASESMAGASMWRWWISDWTKHGELIETAGQLLGNRPIGPRLAIGLANRAANIDGDIAGAISTLESVSTPTPRDRAAALFLQVVWDAGGSVIPVDERLAELQTIAQDHPSAISSVYSAFGAAQVHLVRGEFTKGVQMARATQDAAKQVGAEFFVHLSTFLLCACAVAAGDLRRRDLDVLRRGLLAQRDAGQQTDQWLLVAGAALIFAKLDCEETAVKAYAGFAASVWAGSGALAALRGLFPAEITRGVEAGLPCPLDPLVDDIVAVLADLIDAQPALG